MTAGSIIAIAVIAVLGYLIIFGKLGVLVKGFYGLFVKDIASTPEGAAAVYEELIDKAQKDYNQANNILQKIAGQVNTAQTNVERLNSTVATLKANAERLAKAQRFDQVELIAIDLEANQIDLEDQKKILAELMTALEDAKKANNYMEAKLLKLKRDKTTVISQLQRDKQLKAMYDDMDQLKKVTELDKMADAVHDAVKDARESATGARVVHQTKISTQVDEAKTQARRLETTDYVEDLKRKYAQKSAGA